MTTVQLDSKLNGKELPLGERAGAGERGRSEMQVVTVYW